MSQINRERPLAFSDDFVQARLIENVAALAVSGIVVNLSHDPLVIGGVVPTVVPPWKSAILRDAVIASATRIAVFDIARKTNIGGLVLGDNWDWFGNRFAKFPRTAPLYISCYDVVGEVLADPFLFSNTRPQPGTIERYTLRLNLWWSPAETDCYIHNEHPFLEIHTQIYGSAAFSAFMSVMRQRFTGRSPWRPAIRMIPLSRSPPSRNGNIPGTATIPTPMRSGWRSNLHPSVDASQA